MDELLLGVDVGTSNIKAVLATPDGHVVAQVQRPYPTAHPRVGWVEQNPEDWWQGTVHAVREVLAEGALAPAAVKGVGVSGQGCAVTLIGADGEVIRPAIIWMDARSEAEAQQLRACCGEPILQRNGKQPAAYNADPVLLWLQRHEPENLARARTSLTTTGYLNFRLTGRAVTNVSDASILFAFDLHQGRWSEHLIELFGLPRHLYPPLAACQEVIGTLTAEAAVALGLPEQTPVIAGGEDTSSSGLAIGVGKPGQGFLSLGTAGTIYIAEAGEIVHPQLLAFLHVLPGQILLGGSMVAVGAALDWCRQLLGPTVDTESLTHMATSCEPGAGGLIFLPYLSGELQPINDGNARGVFFGLSQSTGRAEVARAVLEGAAYAIAHNAQIAREAGVSLAEIRAVGGPTRSPLWCQIMADVIGEPIAVLAGNAGAPLGNALLAAAGVGLLAEPAEVAQASAQVDHVYEPDPASHERYQGFFAIYRSLYPQLREQFATLATVSQGER